MAHETNLERRSNARSDSSAAAMTEFHHHLTRRRVLQAAAAMAIPVADALRQRGLCADEPPAPVQPAVVKGRFKQSVCYWCFEKLGLETLARNAAAMGLRSIELVPPEQWPILKRHGLICALTATHDFNVGWNRKENHAMCVEKTRQAIDATAEAGFPSVIAFSGLRKGMPDDVGLENAVAGLKTIIGHAERKKVTICLEPLNSRVPQYMIGVPDYMCDRVEWAVEVCRRIASERMKVLFDIFHVQIMQGDLIARIKQYRNYIGHYHTAGAPGRHEIDETQEINYAAVMRAIAATGFTGYVAHEFIPTRDPLQSLRKAVKLCDV
jgi:hydroxypyruvate isomerase